MLRQLPAPDEFVELVAEHGDPVCRYVLDHLPLWRNDPAAWDAFAQEPAAYCRVGSPPPAAPATTGGRRPPAPGSREAWLEAERTRETFFGTGHPDGGPRMPFGLPGPVYIWVAGAAAVVGLVLHRRKFEQMHR